MPPVICSVPGCDREAFVNCDRCLVPVCDRHNPGYICLELCPDCYEAVSTEAPPEEWKEEEDAEGEEASDG